MLALDVFEAGGFTSQRAQVVKFGAPDFRRAHQLDSIDHTRVLGKNTLDALTEADLADGETGLGTALRAITTPSNACRRSLSPSLIFT